MSANSDYCRQMRLSIIQNWAKTGVQEPRELLPAEHDFRERLNEASIVFKPVPLADDLDLNYRREIGYLIDAFDALPMRPDFAFESTWKAFEAEMRVHNPNAVITDRLNELVKQADDEIVIELSKGVPLQACEYLFKALVPDYNNNRNWSEVNRINSIAEKNGQLDNLFSYMRREFSKSGASESREGALLLRHALRGRSVHMGDDHLPPLKIKARSYLLIVLYLYSVRNDRYHGDFSSPFISSVAKARTYTLPYHSFLVAYYMLLEIWLRKRPKVVCGGKDRVLKSISENLQYMEELFHHNWNH